MVWNTRKRYRTVASRKRRAGDPVGTQHNMYLRVLQGILTLVLPPFSLKSRHNCAVSSRCALLVGFGGMEINQPPVFLRELCRDITINPLRPNNDLSQTSHWNIKGLSVSEVMRIENKITSIK